MNDKEQECPDKKCHDKVTKMGICLDNKISSVKLYSILGGILISVAIIITPFIILSMNSFAETKERTGKVEGDQRVCRTEITNVQEQMTQIRKSVEKIEKQQITKEEMVSYIKDIKDIIKNGK